MYPHLLTDSLRDRDSSPHTDESAGILLRPLAVVVAAVSAEATHRASWEHGMQHWQHVADVGYHLARQMPACDPVVVFLFGLLHDVKRHDDGDDPGHGQRAAVLAQQLNGQLYALAPHQMALLETACRLHNHGGISADATIGTCWDADRLLLWRGGITPDPHGLSTTPARDPACIQWARQVLLQPPRRWQAIWADYGRLAGSDRLHPCGAAALADADDGATTSRASRLSPPWITGETPRPCDARGMHLVGEHPSPRHTAQDCMDGPGHFYVQRSRSSYEERGEVHVS